ncbi:MAG: protein kinase [Bryobacteraceae bacterium]
MQTIGRFEVTAEVGRGGEGIVYAAYDPTIGRKVAIKALLVGSEKASAALRARLRQEAKFSGKLSHPSIVTIHEYLEQDDGAFIVMEFVEGVTLADRMAEPCTEATIISLLRQIADALDYAHAEGVVHRDIKPANMLVTSKGQLKVTDFGIAKLLNDTIAGGQTQTGFVRGTAHYLAPEQIEQKGISGQSDQFSLAVIAYQWLSGRKPFDGDSWTTLLYQILQIDPPPVNRPGEPPDEDINGVLLKALSKSPTDRFASCREFIDTLEEVLGVRGDAIVSATSVPRVPTGARRRTGTKEVTVVLPQPPSPAPSNSMRSIWIGVALAALLALGAVAWRLSTQSAPVVTANIPPVVSTAPPPAAQPAANTPSIPTPSATTEPVAKTPAKSERAPEPKPVRSAQKNEPPPKQQPVPVAAATPPQEAAPPPVAETPAPTGRYLGPPSGRFLWSGVLAAGQTLSINVAGINNRPSIGTIDGRGIPYNLAVTLSVLPPEVRIVQKPSASNGYQLILRNTSASEVRSINVQWREEKE